MAAITRPSTGAKARAMRRTFLSGVLAVCAVCMAGAGCNDKPPVNGGNGQSNISKEELIEKLNFNSDNVRTIVSWSKVELKDGKNPGGRDADATFAFMKPGTIGLLVSKLNQNVIVVKTDGTTFDAYDYENQEGWTGRVEDLSAGGGEFFGFRPDFLAAAMALEHINPEDAELGVTETGECLLTIKKAGENTRKLYVSPKNLEPVRQEIFDPQGVLLLRVIFDKMTKVALGEGVEVKVPGALTLEGQEEGAYLKISNADPTKFLVNNERAFYSAMGNSTRVKFPEGALVNELQPDGTWRPRE